MHDHLMHARLEALENGIVELRSELTKLRGYVADQSVKIAEARAARSSREGAGALDSVVAEHAARNTTDRVVLSMCQENVKLWSMVNDLTRQVKELEERCGEREPEEEAEAMSHEAAPRESTAVPGTGAVPVSMRGVFVDCRVEHTTGAAVDYERVRDMGKDEYIGQLRAEIDKLHAELQRERRSAQQAEESVQYLRDQNVRIRAHRSSVIAKLNESQRLAEQRADQLKNVEKLTYDAAGCLALEREIWEQLTKLGFVEAIVGMRRPDTQEARQALRGVLKSALEFAVSSIYWPSLTYTWDQSGHEVPTLSIGFTKCSPKSQGGAS